MLHTDGRTTDRRTTTYSERDRGSLKTDVFRKSASYVVA